MVRAGIYIRVSKAKRELLDAQRQQPPCEAFAKAQGWSVEQVYLDDSISAYSGVPRERFEDMLSDVRAGRWTPSSAGKLTGSSGRWRMQLPSSRSPRRLASRWPTSVGPST